MCIKCARKAKRFPSKQFSYGQIKALAQSFHKHKFVRLYDKRTNVAVEAHLFKIEQAETNRRFYNRKRWNAAGEHI